MNLERRRFLRNLSASAAGSALMGRVLLAAQEGGKATPEMIRQAEWLAGVSFSDAERSLMLEDLNESLGDYEKSRAVSLDNSVMPAIRFSANLPQGATAASQVARPGLNLPAVARPASDDDLSYASIPVLASLLRDKKISSVELTRLSLARLRRLDPVLRCVITFTDDLALAQAKKADEEIAAGGWRGPLHGIPWAAKDLIAVPGYRTTWGSVPFKDQVRPEKATVAARLEEAGAVLVAKTSVGELAWGDVWFGGTTKNPWKTDQGSSGSSAGSASATAAGCVPFAIGTETLGSIISPATRCGVTGLRPTFGRVSRFGVMSLSPSMDKVGVLARSAGDCALVFGAIEGRDPLDLSSCDGPFVWPRAGGISGLKVGYVAALFEEERSGKGKTEQEKAALRESQEFDRRSLNLLRERGIQLVPIRLPSRYPIGPLGVILTAEAGAMFDGLTRSKRTGEMVRQVKDAWPNVFRQAELIPAVEYLRANRIRTLLAQEMDELMKSVDLYVAPTSVGENLLLTNLTGHPQVVVPNGFHLSDGTPTSITFTGSLLGESALLAFAAAYQGFTDFHTKRPPVAI